MNPHKTHTDKLKKRTIDLPYLDYNRLYYLQKKKSISVKSTKRKNEKRR